MRDTVKQAVCRSVLLLAVGAGMAGCASPRPPAPPTEAKLLFDTCVELKYPTDAIYNELAGTVELKLRVAADGRLVDSVMTQSSGHASLDQATHAWVKTCRYQAATENGKPVDAWTSVTYVWSLEDADGTPVGQ